MLDAFAGHKDNGPASASIHYRTLWISYMYTRWHYNGCKDNDQLPAVIHSGSFPRIDGWWMFTWPMFSHPKPSIMHHPGSALRWVMDALKVHKDNSPASAAIHYPVLWTSPEVGCSCCGLYLLDLQGSSPHDLCFPSHSLFYLLVTLRAPLSICHGSPLDIERPW